MKTLATIAVLGLMLLTFKGSIDELTKLESILVHLLLVVIILTTVTGPIRLATL